MKVQLKNLVLAIFFVFAFASPVMAATVPQASVSAASATCENRVLGIPPWYRGLTKTNSPPCDLKSPDELGGIGNYIWHIALNVIEMAIVAMTYLTVFFILYGGFLFITGGNNPSQVERARKTILNAIIGLVICMGAIALTNLVFRIIT
ncbi:MAG: hypothetical protein ACOH18_04290 [Candidatus Saccharimonadaceae bacterium]